MVDTALQSWLRDDEDYDLEEEAPKFEQELLRPEQSLELFQLCHGLDWKHLPEAGGLLDQPDWFLHDANLIAGRLAYLRRLKKAGREIDGELSVEGWRRRVQERRQKKRRG